MITKKEQNQFHNQHISACTKLTLFYTRNRGALTHKFLCLVCPQALKSKEMVCNLNVN